jgi:fructokinase
MNTTVVCLGELIIDFVPETNGLALSDVASFKRTAGGAPANVAAAVAKLGGVSRFIGKVGADPFGDYLQETLESAGVDVASTLLRTAKASTGIAFGSLRSDGERDFLFYRSPSADMLLAADEVDTAILADAGVFHFGSVSLIAEPCRTAAVSAAKRAREAGALVSYDPNVRLALWPDAAAARESVLARMELADLVKTSEEELTFLTGETDAEMGAAKLLAFGPAAIVVTRGADGCRVITASTDHTVPGVRVDAIDATGAGDGFMGGLLYQLARQGVEATGLSNAFADASFANATLRFANAAGAVTTTKRGAISALPSLREVEALLAAGRI